MHKFLFSYKESRKLFWEIQILIQLYKMDIQKIS